MSSVSRRSVLAAGAAGAAGLAGGALWSPRESKPGKSTTHDSKPSNSTTSSASAPPDSGIVASAGAQQAGIARPALPQAHLLFAVWALTDPGSAGPAIGKLGGLIDQLASGAHPAVAAFGPGGLTVTVGVGPRVVRLVDPALPGAAELPAFAREDLGSATQGDVSVQLCADNPALATAAFAVLGAFMATVGSLSWSQSGARAGSQPDGVSRNLVGFLDGVIVPRGSDQLDRDVWLSGPASVAGGSIAVVRRIRLDVASLLSLPVEHQEQVIGRVRSTGAPLSGGAPGEDVDLNAKTASGTYLVPLDAHARRANPISLGLPLMLRRSYSYDNGPGDAGLMFISFQHELRTFVATQQRMDQSDALMAYATSTASGTYLILPGRSASVKLGDSLFGAGGSR